MMTQGCPDKASSDEGRERMMAGFCTNCQNELGKGTNCPFCEVKRLEARIAALEAALIPAIRLCHQANKSLLAHRSDSFRDCDSPVCRNATRALKGDADDCKV